MSEITETQHPLVFLVGLHGVGKTTIGKALVARGFRHISLGDLSRMLRRKQIPAGYPLRFLRILAAHEPGERMTSQLVTQLLEVIKEHNKHAALVIDGFPAEPYQVLDIPLKSHIVELTCVDSTRFDRLENRSLETPRKWNPDMDSRRDRQLNALLSVALEREGLFVSSLENELISPAQMAKIIHEDLVAKSKTRGIVSA